MGWDKDTTTCHSTNSLAMEQGTPTQGWHCTPAQVTKRRDPPLFGEDRLAGQVGCSKGRNSLWREGESHKGIHEHTHTCMHAHTHCNDPFTTLECNGLECCPISAPICRPFPLTPKDRWLPRTQCHCPSFPPACLLSDGSQTNNQPLTREATHLVEGGESHMHARRHTDRQTHAGIYTPLNTPHTSHTHTHTQHTHTHTATIPWLECVLHTLRRMEGGSIHNPVGKVGVSIVTV